MENQKKNKGVITLLVVIIIILLVLCVLFAMGTIIFNSNKENDNIIDNNSNSENDNSIIKTKLVNNLNNGNSEMTFNGITVKVIQKIDDAVCVADSVSINGKDVSKDIGHCINSYEFYDDNVIIFSTHTSGTVFTIFNVTSNSANLEFNSANNSVLNGYFVKSYSTKGNVITIDAEGCGAQCGVDNDGEVATFEIEYLNKVFSNPKLVNKSTNNKQTNDKITIDLSMDTVTVSKDAPNAKILITGTINLSYDKTYYKGILLSGYCTGMDNEKYLIHGPGDGAIFFNIDGNNKLTLSENVPQDIVYEDGTVKAWQEVDWENVQIKYCKIDKMTAILNKGTNHPETVLNFEKNLNN